MREQGLLIDSDSHNFGFHVRRTGKWIEKPRPIFWEYLFLSSSSPIRSYFKNIKCEKTNPFSGYPELIFEFYDIGPLPYSGRVEYFETNAHSLTMPEDFETLGKTLATIYYFGLSDLHIENLICHKGAEKNSTFIFPIDIEIAFDCFNLLSESYTVKARGIHPKSFGISKMITNKSNIALILEGFYNSLLVLNQNTKKILTILNSLPVDKVPIRRLINDTSNYNKYLRKSGQFDFFEEELLQLRRGDIPYFFSFIGLHRLHYISSKGIKIANIPYKERSQNTYCKTKDSCVRSVAEEEIKIALLQIARTFPKTNKKEFHSKDFNVYYSDDDIFVEKNDSWKLKCKKIKS